MQRIYQKMKFHTQRMNTRGYYLLRKLRIPAMVQYGLVEPVKITIA